VIRNLYVYEILTTINSDNIIFIGDLYLLMHQTDQTNSGAI